MKSDLPMPKNPPDMLSAEEFRVSLARWMLANARTAPPPRSERGQDFVDSYRTPELDWNLTQSYIGADGRAYVHFRAELRLLSCRTRDGKAPRVLTLWQIRARDAAAGSQEDVIGFYIG
jgi:hypothetical protein